MHNPRILEYAIGGSSKNGVVRARSPANLGGLDLLLFCFEMLLGKDIV